MEDLTERQTGTTDGPVFYGTVPPREGTSETDVRSIAEKLAARLEDSGVDAILVYDVQDEEGRNDEPLANCLLSGHCGPDASGIRPALPGERGGAGPRRAHLCSLRP